MRVGDTYFALVDIRKIELSDIVEHQHTTMGKKYSLYNRIITITYRDNTTDFITFSDYAEKSKLEEETEEIFAKMLDIVAGK